jgi:hypothetical protein
MDPATARVALKLQLDDVDAILKTLPQVSHDFIVNSERVAFAALRGELVRKWQEVHGRVYAHSIVRDENARQETYRKLLNEEQQAERKCKRLGHGIRSNADAIQVTTIWPADSLAKQCLNALSTL